MENIVVFEYVGEDFRARKIGAAELYSDLAKNKLILNAFARAQSGGECFWRQSQSLAGGYFIDLKGNCYGYEKEFPNAGI